MTQSLGQTTVVTSKANTLKPNTRRKGKQSRTVSEEEKEIRNILLMLKQEIDNVNKSFDYTTESALIDGFIYELKALNMKYQYYLDLAKTKGIGEKIISR